MVHSLLEAAAAEIELNRADKAYHGGQEPVLVDAAYDVLKQGLRAYYAAHPDARPNDSVLDKVGAPIVAGARAARHATPMLSLSNLFAPSDVAAFFQSIALAGPVDVVGELKLDGLSLSLRYERGVLVRAATRGDGTVGEDVTRCLDRVRGVPRQIDADWAQQGCVEVRGEVCMLRAVFESLNEDLAAQGHPVLSNPRNAAAGALRRDVALPGADLDFFPYQVVVDGVGFSRQSAAVEVLVQAGFAPVPMRARLHTVEEAMVWYAQVAHARADLPVDIDGVVYKVDSQEQAVRLGARSTAPRWAAAHKFPPDKVWTRVRGIDVQVGRTGLLAPVARLEPVMVGGVVVSNATLHNRGYIEGRDGSGRPIRGGLDIRVGDRVEVMRAGDVIPKVGAVDPEARLEDSLPFVFPNTCPSCGAVVVEEGAETRCPAGASCPPQLLGALVHALGRDALDVDGVSEASLAQWISWGWVESLADVWTLEARFGAGTEGALETRLGWGPVSANRAFQALRQARTTVFDRALYALGIPLVGRATARDIAGVVTDLADLQADLDAGGVRVAAVPGVGPKVVRALVAFFADPRTAAPALAAVGHLTIDNPLYRPAGAQAGLLQSWVVVFTGAFPGASREEASASARALGATVAGSVSKKTTVLVAGEKAGSKREKAQSLGVPVVGPSDWARMVAVAQTGVIPDIVVPE